MTASSPDRTRRSTTPSARAALGSTSGPSRPRAFRARHGLDGGRDGLDSQLAEEALRSTGATIMGRRMFSGGEGPWEVDPRADGWWGEDPPFHHPVFVLTHHAREPLEMQGGTTFTFVTDGIESALEQARAAAGDADVAIGGGAEVARQYLRAGLVDERCASTSRPSCSATVRASSSTTSPTAPRRSSARASSSRRRAQRT